MTDISKYEERMFTSRAQVCVSEGAVIKAKELDFFEKFINSGCKGTIIMEKRVSQKELDIIYS